VRLLVLLACVGGARAEDGYALWMRYQPVAATVAADYRRQLAEVVAPDRTPMQRATRDELARSLLDCWDRRRQCERQSVPSVPWCWAPQSSALVAAYGNEIATLGDEGS
jgi:alpha-glucuronidase